MQPILDRNLIFQSGKITMDVELGKIQPLTEVMESSEDTNQQETKENWFRNNVLFLVLDNIISALDTYF